MTLLTYIHAVAVLLTLLKKSFGCKALLPQTASQANFSFHLLKKIIYLRLQTQITSFYLLHILVFQRKSLSAKLRLDIFHVWS